MQKKSKSSNTWKFINKISGREKKSAANINAQKYHSYLLEKIETAKLSNRSSEAPEFSKCNENLSLNDFDEVTSNELLYELQKLSNKQCEHDPLPTWLLKKIATIVAPFILNIFNLSFATGRVPCQFKHAYVTPLLKKSDLNQKTLLPYRPISNLSVLSKLFERIVLPRIVTHLNNNNLLPSFQSAYRRHHSTETALLKASTDSLEAADNKKISLLVLLDLSSAFD